MDTETKKKIQEQREKRDNKARIRSNLYKRKYVEKKGLIKTDKPYEPQEKVKYKFKKD